MNICKLNIFDYVLLRLCYKPLRNIDQLMLDIPFSRTDIFKHSLLKEFESLLSFVE